MTASAAATQIAAAASHRPSLEIIIATPQDTKRVRAAGPSRRVDGDVPARTVDRGLLLASGSYTGAPGGIIEFLGHVAPGPREST